MEIEFVSRRNAVDRKVIKLLVFSRLAVALLYFSHRQLLRSKINSCIYYLNNNFKEENPFRLKRNQPKQTRGLIFCLVARRGEECLAANSLFQEVGFETFGFVD